MAPLPAYVLISATFDRALIRTIEPGEMPREWRLSPPHPTVQQVGDPWVARGESAVLRVPSVLIPDEYNYLLNPAHPAFGRIRTGRPQDVVIDPRLVG